VIFGSRKGKKMKTLRALGSGFIGACALTVLHETVRQFVPDAPRVDVLGKRAIAKSLRAMNQEPPSDETLYNLSLVGDIVSNSLYYSLVGMGARRNALLRGALLGLGAGIGAVVLPEPLGLGSGPTARTPASQALTVAWYVTGGLAAAAAFQLFTGQDDHSNKQLNSGI
jgi:hypothetical protein